MSKDPTGEGVQHALLKMFESWVSFIPAKLGPRHPEAETVPFDTTDVLFICGGAFPGLEDIIARRLGKGCRRVRLRCGDPKSARRTRTISCATCCHATWRRSG